MKLKSNQQYGFEVVAEFEKAIATFFGAPYAVAVDSATHGIELCLRAVNADYVSVPKHTYLSIPMLANKLDIELRWRDENWLNFYEVYSNEFVSICDAAVMWQQNAFYNATIERSTKQRWMSVSFQYQKHLSLGRGGVILVSDKFDYEKLKKMSYDGRLPEIPWRDQNIKDIGYHYYMTPDTANLGLIKLKQAIETKPKMWTINDWPDLTQMDIFRA